MDNKRFAGLDGLRFVSIAFVVLHHLQTFASNFGFNGVYYPVLGVIGAYGIQFFFMGSGFLITYLLLQEQAKNGRIDLKRFYLRRMLRIWPGYFLLVFLMLLVYQHPYFRIPSITDNYISGNDEKSNLLYLLLMPHLAPFANATAPYVHPTYTIGIEEQFYLLWGLLFFFFSKYAYRLIWLIAAAVPFLNVVHEWLYQYTSRQLDPPQTLLFVKQGLYYIQYSKLSTFAIGSLFGYAFFEKPKWVYIFENKILQLMLYCIIAISCFLPVVLPYIQFEYMAVVMGMLMITATFKQTSIINFDGRFLTFLGKISYGIYLFHIFAILLAAKMAMALNLPTRSGVSYLVLSFITLLLSVLFGYCSYYLFEQRFLALKHKLRRV